MEDIWRRKDEGMKEGQRKGLIGPADFGPVAETNAVDQSALLCAKF